MTLKDFIEENGVWLYKFDKGIISITEENGFTVRFQEKQASFNCLKLALICANRWRENESLE